MMAKRYRLITTEQVGRTHKTKRLVLKFKKKVIIQKKMKDLQSQSLRKSLARL